MNDTNLFRADRIREALRQLRDLTGDLEADPNFTAEQVNFLEKRIYEVRTLLEAILPDDATTDIDVHVHAALAKHHRVAAIWSIEDVKAIRRHLTDEQAWEVLQRVGHKHDAEWGISWTTLETIADDLFPEPDNAAEASHGN